MLKQDGTGTSLLITSEALLGSREAADELGIDIDDILRGCGIDPQLLREPDTFIAVSQLVDFLEIVAVRFQCPHFGFLVGQYQPGGRLGLLSEVARRSPDIATMLENTRRYGFVYSQEADWQLRREKSFVFMTRQDRATYGDSMVQLRTMGVTGAFKSLRDLSGGRFQVSLVSFRHKAPAQWRLYERFFEAPVHFEQPFDGIVFPQTELSRRIPTHDAGLLNIAQAYLESLQQGRESGDDIVARVRSQIRHRLGARTCNIEGIAQLLDFNVRTLQRALARHGMTFREMLAAVREEEAVNYLKNSDISLLELSQVLGYRNVSAFSRAFKNSTGCSPDQWRRKAFANRGR